MANLTATLKLNLSYTGPGGGSVNVAQQTAEIAYGADSQGHVDVPAGTVADDPFDVPFGSINAGTLLMVVNNTSQTMNLRVNAAVTGIDIPPGKPAIVMGPLTEASMVATDIGPSASAERFSYFVFGDAT